MSMPEYYGGMRLIPGTSVYVCGFESDGLWRMQWRGTVPDLIALGVAKAEWLETRPKHGPRPKRTDENGEPYYRKLWWHARHGGPAIQKCELTRTLRLESAMKLPGGSMAIETYRADELERKRQDGVMRAAITRHGGDLNAGIAAVAAGQVRQPEPPRPAVTRVGSVIYAAARFQLRARSAS